MKVDVFFFFFFELIFEGTHRRIPYGWPLCRATRGLSSPERALHRPGRLPSTRQRSSHRYVVRYAGGCSPRWSPPNTYNTHTHTHTLNIFIKHKKHFNFTINKIFLLDTPRRQTSRQGCYSTRELTKANLSIKFIQQAKLFN